MKKILFITKAYFPEGYGYSELKYQLSQYTIHNGCYPDEIHMDSEALERYEQLMNKKHSPGVTATSFRGIRIVEVEK